jgi:tetratricopeptide (TPR) repeat protein
MAENDLDKLWAEADRCHEHQEYEREVELRRKICGIAPNNPICEHNLALALMHNNQLLEALELFNDLAEQHPELSRVHNNRAILLMRLGAEVQYLFPLFMQALVTSADVPEFMRHFMNLCASAAYGLDEGTGEALDMVEEVFPKALEQVSPPDLLDKNMRAISSFLNAYRNIAAWREAFAQRRWRTAELALDATKAGFQKLGLDNFVRGIDIRLAPHFALCRDTVGTLERIGSDSCCPSPSMVLKEYERLIQTAHNLAESDKDSPLARLLDILGWFLTGMIRALKFICNPSGRYTTDNVPRSMITRSSSVSFADLGRDLASLLQFVDQQCIEISRVADSIADNDSILVLRDETWAKISLYCNGLIFHFRGVDTVLARNTLGWRENPLDVARFQMRRFKAHVERQAHRDIFDEGVPKENIARALLQAFLSSRSYREVPVRGGQVDILAFTKHGRFLYETKIWRGPAYYQQGLRELEEYITGEDEDQELIGTFYVVFDSSQSRRAQAYVGSVFATEVVCGHSVDVVIINLCLPRPSKKP